MKKLVTSEKLLCYSSAFQNAILRFVYVVSCLSGASLTWYHAYSYSRAGASFRFREYLELMNSTVPSLIPPSLPWTRFNPVTITRYCRECCIADKCQHMLASSINQVFREGAPTLATEMNASRETPG